MKNSQYIYAKLIWAIFSIAYLFTGSVSVANASPAGERSLVRVSDFYGWVPPYTLLPVRNGLSNEIGIDGALSYVSDLSAYWSYSSLHYYRLTDRGTFGGRVNAARRFGTTAAQYQLEAYPILFDKAYAAFNIAYANTTQTLFPSYQYRAEVFLPLRNNFQYSLGQGGQRFPRFSNQSIYLYTASLGKYIGDYYIWARPYYYTPESNFLYEVGLLRSYNDPNKYVSIRLNTGHLPDIGNLPPLDQLVTLSQTAISVAGQVPLRNNFFVKADVSYAHQNYETGLVRNISTVFLSVFMRF